MLLIKKFGTVGIKTIVSQNLQGTTVWIGTFEEICFLSLHSISIMDLTTLSQPILTTWLCFYVPSVQQLQAWMMLTVVIRGVVIQTAEIPSIETLPGKIYILKKFNVLRFFAFKGKKD